MTTGLFEAARQVASIDGLFFTPYGKALLAKTGLALGLVCLGAANAMLLHPGIRASVERRVGLTGRSVKAARLPSFVVLEGAVGAMAFLMVGIMTSASPPRGPEFLPGTGPAVTSATAQAGDMFVNISVNPDQPGANLIKATMASTLRPAPEDVVSATLVLRSPTGESGQPILMERIGSRSSDTKAPTEFQTGGDQLDRAGSWQIQMTATRPGMPDAVATFDLVVGAGSTSRTPIVSVAPIGRALTFGAIVALFALLVGLSLLWRGARRSSSGSTPPSGPLAQDEGQPGRDDTDQRVLAGTSSDGEPR